jgi:hypothetical protein
MALLQSGERKMAALSDHFQRDGHSGGGWIVPQQSTRCRYQPPPPFNPDIQLPTYGAQMCQYLATVRVFWLMLMESPATISSPPPHNSNELLVPASRTPSPGSTIH